MALMRLLLTATFLSYWNSGFAFDAPQYDRNQQAHNETRIVGMECHRKKQTLEVAYFTAYNLPSKTMDLWNTIDLKTNSKDGKTIESIHEIVRRCNLGNNRYIIKFRPVIGNMNLQGACGGDTAGGAKIFKNDILIFDKGFATCDSEETIVKVFISNDSEEPVITKIPTTEFMWGK